MMINWGYNGDFLVIIGNIIVIIGLKQCHKPPHDWEWFIELVKFVIWGMVYGLVLPCFTHINSNKPTMSGGCFCQP